MFNANEPIDVSINFDASVWRLHQAVHGNSLSTARDPTRSCRCDGRASGMKKIQVLLSTHRHNTAAGEGAWV